MTQAVAGLDLAASPKRCTGYAVIVLTKRHSILTKVKCLSTDESIVSEVLKDEVRLIAIDAPLIRIPRMRDVDRLLIKLGFRVFPPNFKWMRDLSVRGWKIAEKLRSLSIEVIETHPHSALLGAGVNSCSDLLELLSINVGVKGFTNTVMIKDLSDSVVAAVVAYCYVKGCSEAVSTGDGTVYILKKLRNM